ncbi:MAG: hypothetical protein EAZ35_02180 [Sphingobacteriia bacterium]|nr:MAG: hypothetical protein EAZ35_02180 [Sphingobacteriia bacterium]
MNRTDILLTDDFDLAEDPVTFDLIEGPSDQQHVQLLVTSDKNEWKENPHAGFGIHNFLKGKYDQVAFERELQIELEKDGYNNAEIIIGNSLADFKILLK